VKRAAEQSSDAGGHRQGDREGDGEKREEHSRFRSKKTLVDHETAVLAGGGELFPAFVAEHE
jgi:hypothetical protein